VLLLADRALEERRRAVRADTPLAQLLDSLARELAPVVKAAPRPADVKALLSRSGGRCETDGTTLEFDPWSPHRHRCPSCGRLHAGDLHDRAWAMPYQLWLAERAVHAALLHSLRGDAGFAAFAGDTIRAFAERYLSYPNADNVLGPTRLFFSTYLESIWLLQICVAAALLEAAGDVRTADLARERIVEPSRALIASYDEGMSNRQVWNNAALLAAAGLLGDTTRFDEVVQRESGLLAHLSRSLLPDGTWYEGENYHQFALRGLWYGVALLEAHGGAVPEPLGERMQRAFAAPFLTALPDFTMPSRKDSQYAVSLRQWRLAELTELGYARRADPLLAGGLARCYEPGHERRDTGRARSTADVERNERSSALTRADLGWRALLFARPELPDLAAIEPRSAMLEHQGYAVFRRDGGVYVGFEFGQTGGGHGHPDRLNLTLYQGATRWLDDLGTGSYVDPSLHWYRSTLAHNAPLVNGTSQPMRDATLLAYDEREGLGWIVAELVVPEHEVRLERTIVVAPDYLIDELRWTSPREVRVDLPFHLDPMSVAGTRLELAARESAAPEDGFVYLRNVQRLEPAPVLTVQRDGHRLATFILTEPPAPLYAAEAPGQPASTGQRFVLIRPEGSEGTLRAVVAWTSDVSVDVDAIRPAAIAVTCRGERHVHRRDDKGWHIELNAGGARSSIDLSGFRARPPGTIADEAHRIPMRLHRVRVDTPWLSSLSEADRAKFLTYELDDRHYRRSEVSWADAGSPSASIAIAAADALVILVDVRAGEAVFAGADAANPYDNEHADTMRAGVQLHLELRGVLHAWMLVPEPGTDRVRVRRVLGSDGTSPAASWRPTRTGYELRVELPIIPSNAAEPLPLSLDLVVNETVANRVRRRGQLVMSGARGEFVYLRGDRQDRAHLIPMLVVP
jgi:hypothetical protein